MTPADIRVLRTTQTRIFRTDALPIAPITTPAGIAAIRETFGLSLPPLPSEIIGSGMLQGTLVLQGGQFRTSGRSFPIHRIAVEPRRIITDLEAPSSISDLLFGELIALVRGLDPRAADLTYDAIVTSDDTACVVHLGFDLGQIVGGANRRVCDLLRTSLPSLGAELEIYPRSVRFRVAYVNTSAEITRSVVSLLPKDFTIEIREQTAPEERIYYTESPSRSEVHLSILEQVEKVAADSVQ